MNSATHTTLRVCVCEEDKDALTYTRSIHKKGRGGKGRGAISLKGNFEKHHQKYDRSNLTIGLLVRRS